MKKLNDEMVLKLNKIFTSEDIDIDSKKELIKLKKIYMDNLRINNILEVENKLYNNKNKEEKITFELARIKVNLFKRHSGNDKTIIRFLSYLEKLIKNKKQLNDKTCDNLIRNIIKIELELGMEIGLLEEFNIYFENIVEHYLDVINGYNDINFYEKESEDIRVYKK